MTTTMTEAERFFYEHAGWAHPVGASEAEQDAARVRNAQGLAAAEQRVKDGPYFVDKEIDDLPWDGDVPWDGPLWVVCLYSVEGTGRPELVGSLGGVACEEGDPYLRVVAAELAVQYLDEG